jgi:hypothetical protein
MTTGGDNKKETKVEELKRVIGELHDLSCSIKEKATLLVPPPREESKADIAKETDTGYVSEELLSGLHNIRRILRESLATLSAFV